MFKKGKEGEASINEFEGRKNLPPNRNPEPAFDEVKEEETWHERNKPEGFIPIENIPDPDFDENKFLEEIDKSLETEKNVEKIISDEAWQRTKVSIQLLKKYGENVDNLSKEQIEKIFSNHFENIQKEVDKIREEYLEAQERAA